MEEIVSKERFYISRKELTKAFDLADLWNLPDGTSDVQDAFEAQRNHIVTGVLCQQADADRKNPQRDDSHDDKQIDTISDTLEAYLLGDANGERPTRTNVVKEIRSTGIIINSKREKKITKTTRERALTMLEIMATNTTGALASATHPEMIKILTEELAAFDMAIEAIKEQPRVRCKDCVYGAESVHTNQVVCEEHKRNMMFTDYCSYGARREDNGSDA